MGTAYGRGMTALAVSWGAASAWFWTRAIFWDEAGLWASEHKIWADWAVHMSYAAVFAYRPVSEWFLGHPLYDGRPFTYPFVADAISGLLMRLGVDVATAFLLPSVVVTWALLATLYRYYYSVSPGPRRSWLAVTLLCTGGSLGFFAFLGALWQGQGLAELWLPSREYTVHPEVGMRWINNLLAQFLPQRAFLFGAPWYLAVLVMMDRWRVDRWHQQRISVVVAAGMTAMLLMLHIHTFIVAAFVGAAFLLLRPRLWRHWLSYAGLVALVGGPLYWVLYGQSVEASFFSVLPGWLAHPHKENVVWPLFWWRNWGLFLPLALVGTWMQRRHLHPTQWAAWFMFGAANVILFQPHDWDNSKIFLWVFLFLCPLVLVPLRWLWHRSFGRVVAGVLFFLLTATGWIDLWRLTAIPEHQMLMLSHEDAELARVVRTVTPTDAVILTSDQHNHWVTTMTGRRILMGYRGWLWTYGIDYTRRERDIRDMYAGRNVSELFAQYQVSYVVIGPSERYDFAANESFFDARYPVLAHSADVKVYDVRVP